MRLENGVYISREVEQLAKRTLENSMLELDAVLMGTDVEDVLGRPLIYFDFRSAAGRKISRVYAEPD